MNSGHPTPNAPVDDASPTESQLRAFELFAQGASILEAAEKLNRAPSTTRGYLVAYLRHHHITDPSPWVAPTTAHRIEQAATQAGTDRLRPIFDLLEGTVPFEEIQVVVECLRNRLEAQ